MEFRQKFATPFRNFFLGAFSYGTVFSSMTIYYNQHLGSAITGILLALSAVATFVAGILAGFLLTEMVENQ